MKIIFRIFSISLVMLSLVFSCKKSDPKPETIIDPLASNLVFNVRDAAYGAKGDGNTDDTQAIQSAINATGGKGDTVFVPNGNYRVNTLTGIQLKDNMTLKLDINAVLQAIPNGDSSIYEIIGVHSVSHVNIIGGTVIGERDKHWGTTGQWGMGINIKDAHTVMVDGTVVKECWGDGFYIGGNSSVSSDVTLNNITSDHNRRQGLSIVCANNVFIRNSIFENTIGTLPEAGIDIEPNLNQSVKHVSITGCTFRNNNGAGFTSGCPIANTGKSFVDDVVVDGNTFTANMKRGIAVSNCTGHKILNNNISASSGSGIYFRNSANNSIIKKNTVTGSIAMTGESGYGILLYLCQGDTITGNTITGNAGLGIRDDKSTGVNTISDNVLSGNGTK